MVPPATYGSIGVGRWKEIGERTMDLDGGRGMIWELGYPEWQVEADLDWW